MLRIVYSPILSAVKEGQQKYCETVYSCSGINHMWILKNSKDLLDNLKSRSFSQVSSIKTFDFSTLYTTLPRSRFVCGIIVTTKLYSVLPYQMSSFLNREMTTKKTVSN
jgi:hypothetical protein